MPRTRSSTVVASPAAAAETAICTIGNMAIPASNVVDLEGSVDITIGTAGTSVTLKLERGSVAGGTVVATFGPFTVTAGNRYNFSINTSDSQANELAGAAYVLTATVANATAASTVNAVNVNAIW